MCAEVIERRKEENCSLPNAYIALNNVDIGLGIYYIDNLNKLSTIDIDGPSRLAKSAVWFRYGVSPKTFLNVKKKKRLYIFSNYNPSC